MPRPPPVPPAVQDKIRRTYRRVHREFYARYPKLNEALPGYLAETDVSAGQDSALEAYFDHPNLQGTHPMGRPTSSRRLETNNRTVSAFNSSAKAVDVGPIPESVLHLEADATVPPYRFCRPTDESVLRTTEHFRAFYHCIVSDDPDEKKIDFYKNNLQNQVGLEMEPERVPYKTWRRLTADGLDPSIINQTRILPVHGDTCEDLDVLRDLPPFPRPSKGGSSRATTWGEAAPMSADTFVDNDHARHRDLEINFCPWPSCRTFGCALHEYEWEKPGPFDRSQLPGPVKMKFTSSQTPCSRACVHSPNPPADHSKTDWPDAERQKLADILAIQKGVTSCILRPLFVSYTCKEINVALLRLLRIKQTPCPPPVVEDWAKDVPGCKCHSKQSNAAAGKVCGTNCPCARAERECNPETCHPQNETEDWERPRGEEGHHLGPKCCANVPLRHSHRGKPDSMGVAISTLSGYGLTARANIPAHTILFDYTGERVLFEEGDNRDMYNVRDRAKPPTDLQNLFLGRNYAFTVAHNFAYVALDAANFGNESRFINTVMESQGNKQWQNCVCQNIFSDGLHRVIIKSSKFIPAGAELLLDYGKKFHESTRYDYKSKRESKPKPKIKGKAKRRRR